MHRAGGRPRQAVQCERRSAALVDQCEGARTPALMGSTAVDPLSRREREIALLAVGGSSSREIAEQLSLSIRTVDNHLQRIYLKLGIPGRSHLAAALDLST
jgi:DNA-binding CsgD family transcriptional regulator